MLVEAAGAVNRWEIHRAIRDVLERRDPSQARVAMLAHFSGIERRTARATAPTGETKFAPGHTPCP